MESYLAVENEDIQIRWHGGSTFNVFSNMRYDAEVPTWSVVDCFTHYGDLRVCEDRRSLVRVQEDRRASIRHSQEGMVKA